MDLLELERRQRVVTEALFKFYHFSDKVEEINSLIWVIDVLRKNKIDERIYQVMLDIDADNIFWVIESETENLNGYYDDFEELNEAWEKHLADNSETKMKFGTFKQVGFVNTKKDLFSITSTVSNCEIEDADGNTRSVCLEYRFSPDKKDFPGELLLDGELIARCDDPRTENRGGWRGDESNFEKLWACPPGYSKALFIMLAYPCEILVDHIQCLNAP